MKLLPLRRWPLRFSLRAMLAGVAIAAIGIGLWIRPHTVEVFRPDDGTLLARYRVQRNWRGELVARGSQKWFLPEGGCYRRQDVFGAVLRDGELQGPGQRGAPVYPPHRPPDPPTSDYVFWLRNDDIPVSTDLPSSSGELFSYP
jgi:hypothetical protein